MIMWQPGVTIEDIEKKIILKAVEFYRSKSVAAGALGISVKTIYNKLNQYGVLSEDEVRTQTSEGLDSASQGSHPQPSAQDAEKPGLPMQKREEVQGVSHADTAEDHSQPAHSSKAKAGRAHKKHAEARDV